MGGFPQDEAKAFGVISWGSAAAALSGATKVIVKSVHEAFGIPTKEANASGLKATKQLVTMLRDQKMPLTHELEVEINMILAETRCIVDKIFESGMGDIAKGTIRAFEAGIIDVPFAPSKYNLGRALPARDNNGAIRFLDFGNVPFNDDIKSFHLKRMEERSVFEKRSASFQMVIDDIYAISKGRLVGRPK
jgi:methylaspartate mutase epsilon subunit